MPQTDGFLQRKCACGNHTIAGGECQECSKNRQFGLQTKLRVNEPGDVYEQEADWVAKQVMQIPDGASSPPALSFTSAVASHAQRKCSTCEEEDKL